MWLGDGGRVDYASIKNFFLLDTNDRVVFTGPVFLRLSADSVYHNNIMFGPDNFNKTHVYSFNFSDFADTGQYRVWIPGVGVSFSFNLAGNIYEQAFKLQMKGYYHQRSGIAMELPHTAYRRPRNQHPADGQIVYSCNKTLFFCDSINGNEPTYANPFNRIANSIILDSNNPNAWGGWMDAADYDRRFQHFVAVHAFLELFEAHTSYFEKVDLNIPESNNHIPDILDEALWCMNLFLRTQTAEGEIAYGIESVAHPNAGESSWNESLPLALVPGCPGIAYLYAATAARLSVALKMYDNVLSEKYLESANKACAWAESNLNNPLYKNAMPITQSVRFDLAVFMFEATSAQKWKDRANHLATEIAGSGSFFVNQDTYRGVTKFLALSNKEMAANKQTVKSLKQKLVQKADSLLLWGTKLAYGEFEDFSYNCWIAILYNSGVLVNAFSLLQEERYLNQVVEAGHFGMGANPLNASLTTGLGERFVYQWDDEAICANQYFATGIPVYGPFPYYNNRLLPENDFFWDQKKEKLYNPALYPKVNEWPMRETYFELMKFPAMNEFTIMQNMADQAYRWGWLAAFYKY
ncbi:MAG: hypothetical protein HC896_12005 [Bacteroidales bacterium]|nr:hypothetical protein [Bacteroidales bacterium]